MFTGIIQFRGTITESRDVPFGKRFIVNAADWSHKPKHGESICVNGTCLTVISESGELAFDVIAQTLRTTTLGYLKPGDPVNLESCLTPQTLLSGHIVQGHIDGTGKITNRLESEDEVRLTIQPPPELMKYMVPKGSVAVDGVSMTLAEINNNNFTLALIPTTLELTTLGLATPGTKVNIEADILVKTIAHLMQQMNQ